MSHSFAPDVEVRRIAPGEHAAAGQVTQSAWREFAVPGDPVWEEYFEQLGDAAARAERAVVLVAVEDGTVVGTATVELEQTLEGESLPPGEASFRMFAVEPSVRGRGIGRQLVEACLAEARTAGKAVVTLLTAPGMAAAAGLYASLGFERDESADVLVAPGYPLLGYRRDL